MECILNTANQLLLYPLAALKGMFPVGQKSGYGILSRSADY